MAPVKQNQTLKFVISAPTGETWTKEITVTVGSPEKFEVFQNYPNPFNPSTTISYQLTANSKVNLKIFNMLGQEVALLVDGDRLAGYHQEVWDARQTAGGLAGRLSSGVYVYQLIASDDHGTKQVDRKRMLLLK
jgi:flagellar hook assembly protein FlgD